MLNRLARINDFSDMKEELAYIRSIGYGGDHADGNICYDYVYKWTKMYKCCKEFGLLQPGKKVIDLGGGMSPLQYILANHGCQVFNLDLQFTNNSLFPSIHNKYYEKAAPQFIEESEKNSVNIIRIKGDAMETLQGIPTNSMDAVIDVCALHVFINDGKIVNQISRVLKPNGRMISIGDIANPHLGKCDEEFLYPKDMAKTLSQNKDLQLIEPYDYETWEKELMNHDNLMPRKHVDHSDLSLLNMKTDPRCISYHNVPIYPIHIWTGIFVLQKKSHET